MVECRDWASLLLSTLDESPLLLQHSAFRKRSLPCNSWQCHILCCMFSCLAPRIRSEIINWSFYFCCHGRIAAPPASASSASFSFLPHWPKTDEDDERKTANVDATMMEVALKETFHAIKEAESFFKACQQHEDWGLVRSLVSTACTGEALTLHIHNLFWCTSSLLLATHVALGYSEEKLNALVEQQVHCWSTHIARYFRLGVELLDLRQVLVMSEEFKKQAWHSTATGCKEEKGGDQIPPPKMLKLLMHRLKRALMRSSATSSTRADQDQNVGDSMDALLRDLKIDFRDLAFKQKVGTATEEREYFPAMWLGFCVSVKKCSMDTLKHQACTLLRLRNPFILQLIGWSEVSPVEAAGVSDVKCDASCYMVMEAAETDLKSFILDANAENSSQQQPEGGEEHEDPKEVERPSPFVFCVALDMMLQIARGMWYLHRNGVAHGELQSSKILLETSKLPELQGESYARLKICDIGISDPHTSGEVEVSLALSADVLSFGQLSFEILTGKPYPTSLHGHNEDSLPPPKPPGAVPLLLVDCLIACCSAQPQSRPEFGAICGLLRHIKLIVTNPNRLERLLNFFPDHGNGNSTATTSTTSQFVILITKSSGDPSSPLTDSQVLLDLININVNVLHESSPAEIYPLAAVEFVLSKENHRHQNVPTASSVLAGAPLGLKALENSSVQLTESITQQHVSQPDPLVAVEFASSKENHRHQNVLTASSVWGGTPLGLKALEKLSVQLMESITQQRAVQPDEGLKFVIANASTLKSSLVEGFSGLMTSSWTSTSLGMGTLEMWLPHLPSDWKLVHHIALGVALCLRHVAKAPPKMGYYSEQGVDGFYPIHPDNILLNCQFKAALRLSSSPASWRRLFEWAGVHPQVDGDNALLSVDSYTTYYFGHLLSAILRARRPTAVHNKRVEFVLSNLSARCIQLKYLSMTEVVTILLNEHR